MRLTAALVALGLACCAEVSVAATRQEIERKNKLKISKDSRKEHRERLLAETHRLLRESGVLIENDYDHRRKLIDVDSINLHNTPNSRRGIEIIKSEARKSDLLPDEDGEFWNRFLQNGDFSLPTLSPTTIQSEPTRSPTEDQNIVVPTAAPTDVPVTSEPTSFPGTIAPTSSPGVPATPLPTASPVTGSPTTLPDTPTTTPPITIPVTGSPTAQPDTPSTPAPTAAPVETPSTVAPTSAPVDTDAPTAVPVTDSPTTTPVTTPPPVTNAPTTAPVETTAPTSAPTTTPDAPTDPPVATPPPTDTPTGAPSTPPVQTLAPTDPPTDAPTAAPVETPAPTAAPVETPAPTTAPVATPAPTNPPTGAPTAGGSRIREVIEPVALFGGTEFQDPTTYQSRALSWLEADSFSQDLTDERIIQRYALGCIYYATFNVSTVFTDEALNGQILPWLRSNGWMTATSECDWANTICDANSRITVLDLFGNLVTGEFPPEVVYLSSSLTVLDLGENFVFTRGDTFNTYLGQLTELTDLRYENTNFINDAGIPTELGNLKKLEFYNCANVRYVGALNGAAFPSDMTALTHLEIEFNSYNSSVPLAVGSLPALRFFYVRNSFVDGDLSFMQNMPAIEECWVDTNPGLGNKPLPAFLGQVATLASFSVTECGYTGALPTEIGLLTRMQQMFYYDNDFSSMIPDQWNQFESLRRLELQINMFSGVVPLAICSQTFGLLTTLKADCVNCPMGGIPCCTSCFTNGVEQPL